ncbi:MAG: DedA family protein [Alphaproteobacteria bacterium]|nr:DedA family protein [Alphaproteobacteria bacterium]
MEFLDHLLGLDIEHLIAKYGYWAIVINTFIEGETIQIIAGWAAHEELLSLWLVVLSGFAGTVAGDQLYYWIGRRWGRPLMHRFPRLEARCQPAFGFLRRYDNWFILGFRFVYGVRNVAPFACGAAGIGVIRYTTLNVIAAAIWAVSFATAGYFFGKAIAGLIDEYGLKLVLPTVIGLVVLGVAVTRWRARKKVQKVVEID